MAISTSATPGIIIESAAKDGTLPSQTPAAANQIIFDTTIATNNGSLFGTPSFVGRKVLIRRLLSTKEAAKIISISANGLTGTINQNWRLPPSSGDSYHISYNIDDVTTVTGCTLVSKTNIYDFSRQLTIGNGTDFAYFAFIDGLALSNDDSTGGGNPGVTVEKNGRFDIGYLQDSVPVGGAYLFGTQNGLGEIDYLFKSGSFVYLYDAIFRSSQLSLTLSASNHVHGIVKSCKFFDYSHDSRIYSGSWHDINFVGTVDNAAELITISGSVDIDRWTLTSMSGFSSKNDSIVETLSIKNVNFVSNPRLLTVHRNKTWNVINPIWSFSTSSQTNFWFSGSSGKVNEYFSFSGSSKNSAGSPLATSSFYIYEGKISGTIVNSASSDVGGVVVFNILNKNLNSASNGSINSTHYGQFTTKVYNYTYSPFVSSITVGSGALNPEIVLIRDLGITNTDFNAAIFSGAGIVATSSLYSTTLLSFNSNSFGFTEGERVTGQTSAASGTIVEVAETGSVSGKLYLRHRNSIGFIENERLSGSLAGASAASASSPNYNFKWEISGANKPLSIMYNYLSAKLASGSLGEDYKKVVIWGESEHGLMLKFDGNSYYTERNVNKKEGVYASKRGAGSVSYFIDNSGSSYVPPASVTLELTNVISGSRCLILDSSGSVLMSKGAESSTVSEPYTYVGDVNITIRVRKSSEAPKYIPYEANGTVTDSGFSLSVNQILDSIVS